MNYIPSFKNQHNKPHVNPLCIYGAFCTWALVPSVGLGAGDALHSEDDLLHDKLLYRL